MNVGCKVTAETQRS